MVYHEKEFASYIAVADDFAALVRRVCPTTYPTLTVTRLRAAVIAWYGLREDECEAADAVAKAVYERLQEEE